MLILEHGLSAARKAAQITLKARREGRVWSEAFKAGQEPFTQADLASQAVIIGIISKHFPDDLIWAEESSASVESEEQYHEISALVESCGIPKPSREELNQMLDYRGTGISGRIWTVDPIDGTKGFIAGLQYAVAIGLVENGVPVFGIVAAPADNSIYYACRGQGAFIEPLYGGEKNPLSVSQCTPPESVVLASRAHDSPYTQKIMSQIGTDRVFRCDSQVKYAMLAEGRAHIYLRPPSSRCSLAWDHVPGIAILEESGGRVTDLDGKPLDFSSSFRMEKNRGILATNGAVHDAILEFTREA